MKYSIKTICSFSVFMLLLSGAWNQNAQAQTYYDEEIRGIWVTNVDSDVMFSKAKLAESMNYLAEQGFNVIFPVVWNKGYTLHPSDVMVEYFGESYRQDPALSNQNRDPLQEIIVEAHKHGMEVIPWFEYGFAASFSQNGGHIVQTYPHWASEGTDGEIVTKNGFDWLNAIHPEVQDFMKELILEVIKNYDVDGFQGDDRLPAMASEAGYSDYTVELYRSEHDGEEPPFNPGQVSFLEWKAGKLTTWLGELHSAVKAEGDQYIVSLSPSIFDFSYREYLQNWPTWLDSGYVDMIHPQAYRYDISSYKQLIRGLVGPNPGSTGGYVKPKDRKKLAPGVLIKAGSNTNGASYVKSAVDYHREFNIPGEVFFFYEGLRNRNEFVGDTLGKYYYNTPAILPFRERKLWRPEAEIVNETDTDVELSGNWTVANTPAGYEGRSVKAEPGNGATLSWLAEVPKSAWYNVYVYAPYSNEATDQAYVEAFGSEDSASVSINQRVPANEGWTHVGNLYFEKGFTKFARIVADSSSDNRTVFADAAMLLLDRKKSPDVDFEVLVTDLEDEEWENRTVQPQKTSLLQNYPNPFNPATTIRFELAQSQEISLEIFNMLGQKVAVLNENEMLSAGRHSILFDASHLSSGTYIYRLKSDQQVISKTMTLIK